jgi:hypothetical protein
MAGRNTNLALAALLAIALGTGVVSFGIGTGWVRPVLVIHGIAALAIVLLAPWKSAIARRGLRRRRNGSPLSLVLAVLVVVTIASGLAHSVFDIAAVGPLMIMQIHVGAAVGALVLGLVHMRKRPQPMRAADLSRRTFLRASALAGTAAVTVVAVDGIARATGLPGGARRFTGSHERGSFEPAEMPVTSWLNDSVPAPVSELAVSTGSGSSVVPITDLTAYDDRVTATLDCTSGWHSTQIWVGARLDRLIGGGGTSIRVISATGYERRFPVGGAAELLLATHVGEAPLSAGHGAPVRLVAPGRRGFWWVKWVSAVVVDDRPAWWQPPFPLT